MLDSYFFEDKGWNTKQVPDDCLTITKIIAIRHNDESEDSNVGDTYTVKIHLESPAHYLKYKVEIYEVCTVKELKKCIKDYYYNVIIPNHPTMSFYIDPKAII